MAVSETTAPTANVTAYNSMEYAGLEKSKVRDLVPVYVPLAQYSGSVHLGYPPAGAGSKIKQQSCLLLTHVALLGNCLDLLLQI